MRVEVRPLALKVEGWQACLLPVSLQEGEYARSGARRLVDGLGAEAESKQGWAREVWLHTWKLHVENRAALLEPHLAAWKPQLGLGIWPYRQPPTTWNEESFMDAAGAEMLNEEPDLPSYRLMRLRGSADDRKNAAALLAGAGAVTQVFISAGFDVLERQGRAAFLPLIRDAVHTHERFYLPLLDSKSLNACTAIDLDQWLSTAMLYMRESAEDGGVLVLFKGSLKLLLESAAAAMEVDLLWSKTLDRAVLNV